MEKHGKPTYICLFIRGCSYNRNKDKCLSGRSKSRGTSKYLGKSIKICWSCGKERNYNKYYKSKIVEKGKGSKDAPSTEAKNSSTKGGDLYFSSSCTHVDLRHEWLTQVHPFI